jgi:hypothetical protein
VLGAVKLGTVVGAQWEIQVYAQAMLCLAKLYFSESLNEWYKICSKVSQEGINK